MTRFRIKVMVSNYHDLFKWINAMNKTVLLASLCLLLSTACTQASNELVSNPKTTKQTEQEVKVKESKIWHQVTVKFQNFEGGFYGLVSRKGDKYLPMNLAKKYQLPGTVLEVQGHIVEDMITIQQWGQVFKITDVKLIKLGKAKTENSF